MTGAPDSQLDVHAHELHLRRRLFEQVMAAVVITGGVGLAVWLLFAGRMGVTDQLLFFVALYAVLLVAWLARFLPFWLRFTLLVAVVLSIGEYILWVNGLVGAGRYMLMMAPLLAAVLLGFPGFLGVGVLALVGYAAVALAFELELTVPLVAQNPTDALTWTYEVTLPVATTVLLGWMILYYRRAILTASFTSQTSAELAQRLQQEAQMETQTARRRAEQLARAAKLARTITRMQTPDELAWRLVQELAETFDLYQVNLFMTDVQGEYLHLTAASGELGWQLVKEGWDIPFNSEELPARVAQLGHELTRQIAAHPRLAHSKAEVALPLLFRGEILGVLDIHGRRKPFTSDDVDIFRILVDQAAATLNTLRLLKESEIRAQELRGLYARSAAASWRALLEEERQLPYQRIGLIPEPEVQMLARTALETRKPLSKRLETGLKGHLLVVPLVSRDIPIGYLAFTRALEREEWDLETLSLVETAAERLSTALDTARLLLTSRRQALHEEQLGRLGDLIWASPSVETLMERAVQELGRLLSASEVSLYMTPETERAARPPGTGPLRVSAGK